MIFEPTSRDSWQHRLGSRRCDPTLVRWDWSDGTLVRWDVSVRWELGPPHVSFIGYDNFTAASAGRSLATARFLALRGVLDGLSAFPGCLWLDSAAQGPPDSDAKEIGRYSFLTADPVDSWSPRSRIVTPGRHSMLGAVSCPATLTPRCRRSRAESPA